MLASSVSADDFDFKKPQRFIC